MRATADPAITRKITRLYLLALTAVALLSVGGQVWVQRSLGNQLSDSRVINIAGRQRMLSQKITKTILLAIQTDRTHLPALLAELQKDLHLWEKCHTELTGGYLDAMKIQVNNSDSIRAMFAGIEPDFKAMLVEVNQIRKQLSSEPVQTNTEMKNTLDRLLIHERAYLEGMDKIVFQYDAEANHRVNDFQRIELILLIATLTVIVLEGLFIFKPAVNQIRQTIRQLINSERHTLQINEELITTNQSLQEAREALLKETNQKYLREMNEQKMRTAYLIEGQEEERKRIAQEIHDGLGQMLTALKFGIEKVGDFVNESEKGQRDISNLRNLITQTIAEARTISFNLMPAVLSDFGIVSALKLLSSQVAASAGVHITFTNNWNGERPAKNIEIGLYRIAQEALHNAIKYASAREITVDLSIKKKYLHLKIEDDGQGFVYNDLTSSPQKEGPAHGISNMKERAFMINGDIKILTKPGKGTSIHLKIPFTNLYHEQD